MKSLLQIIFEGITHKQSPENVLQQPCFAKLPKIHRKVPAMETFLKLRPLQQMLSSEFCEMLLNCYSIEQLGMATSMFCRFLGLFDKIRNLFAGKSKQNVEK